MVNISTSQLETYQHLMMKIFQITADRPIKEYNIHNKEGAISLEVKWDVPYDKTSQ